MSHVQSKLLNLLYFENFIFWKYRT